MSVKAAMMTENVNATWAFATVGCQMVSGELVREVIFLMLRTRAFSASPSGTLLARLHLRRVHRSGTSQCLVAFLERRLRHWKNLQKGRHSRQSRLPRPFQRHL